MILSQCQAELNKSAAWKCTYYRNGQKVLSFQLEVESIKRISCVLLKGGETAMWQPKELRARFICLDRS